MRVLNPSYFHTPAKRMRMVMMAVLMGFAALITGWQSSTQAQGRAAANLPDFTEIVEQAEHAVVNIRTTAKVGGRNAPGGGGGGQDPYEMFRWFFGPDFQGRGGPWK